MDNCINITTNSKLIAYQPEFDLSYYSLQGNNNLFNNDWDILAIKFCEDIEKSKDILKKFLPVIKKNLMICGCGKDDVDSILLPELIKVLDRVCIISYATEKNYKNIVPAVIKGGHYLVLKTPIDINLAKELNILSTEIGLSKDKIIMNTDIGGLGYGYEYGYSIIEKIKLEKNDEYLNFPIISEVSTETAKTKEAKSDLQYAQMAELSAISGVLAAGANIVTVKFVENIKILKGLL